MPGISPPLLTGGAGSPGALDRRQGAVDAPRPGGPVVDEGRVGLEQVRSGVEHELGVHNG